MKANEGRAANTENAIHCMVMLRAALQAASACLTSLGQATTGREAAERFAALRQTMPTVQEAAELLAVAIEVLKKGEEDGQAEV